MKSTELVPSEHLADITELVQIQRRILKDPNTPLEIHMNLQDSLTICHAYSLQLGLKESLDITSRNKQETSPNVYMRFVQLMIDRAKHLKTIVLTPEKREAIQQEIDALTYVLNKAREA